MGKVGHTTDTLSDLEILDWVSKRGKELNTPLAARPQTEENERIRERSSLGIHAQFANISSASGAAERALGRECGSDETRRFFPEETIFRIIHHNRR